MERNGNLMERSRVAVRSVIERFSNTETVVTLNERRKRKITNIVKNDPTVSSSEVAAINEDLKSAGIKVARRKPIITTTQHRGVLWYNREPLYITLYTQNVNHYRTMKTMTM